MRTQSGLTQTQTRNMSELTKKLIPILSVTPEIHRADRNKQQAQVEGERWEHQKAVRSSSDPKESEGALVEMGWRWPPKLK